MYSSLNLFYLLEIKETTFNKCFNLLTFLAAPLRPPPVQLCELRRPPDLLCWHPDLLRWPPGLLWWPPDLLCRPPDLLCWPPGLLRWHPGLNGGLLSLAPQISSLPPHVLRKRCCNGKYGMYVISLHNCSLLIFLRCLEEKIQLAFKKFDDIIYRLLYCKALEEEGREISYLCEQ